MDVGQTQEEGPVMILPVELNQVLAQEGLCASLCASLGSLMTVTGQFSSRKGLIRSATVWRMDETGEAAERKTNREIDVIVQATVHGRTEPRQDQRRRECVRNTLAALGGWLRQGLRASCHRSGKGPCSS